MPFTAETRRVLEMQNFTPAYMKGWTYLHTGRLCQNQNFLDALLRQPDFLTHGAPLRARESPTTI